MMLKNTSLKIFLSFIFIALLTFGLTSCKNNQEVVSVGTTPPPGGTPNDSTSGTINISGQVINNVSGIPLDSVLIRIFGGLIDVGMLTDGQGKYSVDIDLPSTTNLTVTAFKAGFYLDTLNFTATAGSNALLPLLKLDPVTTGTLASGDPVSIYLLAQSTAMIGVKESGSVETAQLIFEVQDSAGVPIDIDHSIDVTFTMGSAPGGGEVISPTVVKTNTLGQAVVNLTSGIIAGVVQVIAEMQVDGITIRSLPVAITIHGGLPDYDHFSIAPASLNFAGYNIFGLHNVISAFVGDKYANPVRPLTSVYFTTTGGIIEGSAETDIEGIGSVNLISALPHPDHPVLGPGFATITASTADENLQTISRETIVLFSGISGIKNVSPTSFSMENGGSQSFVYDVSDQFGNPLASSTTITVSVEGDNVDVQGDDNVEIPDTQSEGWTHFGFIIFDTAPDTVLTSPVAIEITTTGPNGVAGYLISGTKK